MGIHTRGVARAAQWVCFISRFTSRFVVAHAVCSMRIIVAILEDSVFVKLATGLKHEWKRRRFSGRY
jgi:hypothetical protein